MLVAKLLTAKLTPPSNHFKGFQLALNLPSLQVNVAIDASATQETEREFVV